LDAVNKVDKARPSKMTTTASLAASLSNRGIGGLVLHVSRVENLVTFLLLAPEGLDEIFPHVIDLTLIIVIIMEPTLLLRLPPILPNHDGAFLLICHC